jgi:aldehyde:ferredoxin oxidoreductase
MGGYMGKYLIVNLSNKSHEVVPLTDGFYRKFLSGYGLGAAVITERQKPGIDPLSPERGCSPEPELFFPDDTWWLASRRLPKRGAMRIPAAFSQWN